MEYSELEKKVIKRGYQQFRKELEEASESMIPVLKKYGITHGHPILPFITLNYPYRENEPYYRNAVNIPNDEGLKTLDQAILDNFLNEIKGIKEITDNLDLG